MALSPQIQSPVQARPSSIPAGGVSRAGSSESQLPPSRRDAEVTTGNHGAGRSTASAIAGKLRNSLKAPVLAGAALLAALIGSQMVGGESSHDNWIHHQQASRHADADGHGIKWISSNGPAVFTNSAAIDVQDLDTDTTRAFHAAMYRRDRQEIEQVMQNAQPPLIDSNVADDLDIDAAVPTLTDGLADAVLDGDTKFFHIFLFDSCYEDGDVVDVKINGQRFATVQLTNAGVTLSVPMNTTSVISIEGVYDGGGGITIACRTSQGEGFMRDLLEGEEQVLAATGR